MNKQEVKVVNNYIPSRSSDDTPLDELMEDKVFVASNGTNLPYRIYVPENYDASFKYPVASFFHGSGERGVDNLKQLGDCFVFLPRLLKSENLIKYPCIILAPQCKEDEPWVDYDYYGTKYDVNIVNESRSLFAFRELLKDLEKEYSIDLDRLYITGLSLGGGATLDLIARNPSTFACGIAMTPNIAPVNNIDSFKDANLWQFHGIVDTICLYDKISVPMFKCLKKKKIYSHLTTYPKADHGLCWIWGYQNPDLFDYMFSSRLSKINDYLLNNKFSKDPHE